TRPLTTDPSRSVIWSAAATGDAALGRSAPTRNNTRIVAKLSIAGDLPIRPRLQVNCRQFALSARARYQTDRDYGTVASGVAAAALAESDAGNTLTTGQRNPGTMSSPDSSVYQSGVPAAARIKRTLRVQCGVACRWILSDWAFLLGRGRRELSAVVRDA